MLLRLVIFAFTFFIAACHTNKLQEKKKKPNVLMIVVDDLRPLINSYGASKMITPHIDKLAAEAIQFNRAFTNIAVCGASRASFFTGLRPNPKRFTSYNSWASKDAPNSIPMQAHFKQNGYETISYGKVYHYVNDFKQYWTEIDKGAKQNAYQDPLSIEASNQATKGPFGKRGPAFEFPDVSDESYADGKTTLKAIKKLKDCKKNNKPFFMAVGYVSPHLPFIQPKKYWDLYKHHQIQLARHKNKPIHAPDIAISSQHNWSELRNNYLNIPKEGPLSDKMAKNLVHGYQASVSYVDSQIGKLLRVLKSLKLDNNTIVVLWSDHGFFLGEHGLWCKHSTFYEAVHIPLLIKAPIIEKSSQTNSMAELVDLYPTLCELTGLSIPKGLHGQSLLPALKHPKKEFKKEIYTRYKQGEAVIDGSYAFTAFWSPQGKYLGEMLFDMEKDHYQNVNLSKLKKYHELVEMYREKLEKHRENSHD